MSSKKPAGFPRGRWEKLGEVGVDSASIGITDLLFGTTNSHFRAGAVETRYAVPRSAWAGDWGTGIRFWAGFGDGAYDIWAWIIDTGEDGEVDERIAQVVITMIDEKELVEWREM